MKLKLFEPSNEVKAFIYQQIQELARFIPDSQPVIVLTRRFESEKRPQYLIEMSTEVMGQNLKVRARSDDIFEALIKGRLEMGQVLQALQTAMQSGPEREQAITSMLSQPSWAVH